MHRFIIEPGYAPGDAAALAPHEARHAVRVLRLRPGARVQLSDGRGKLFMAEFQRADSEGVTALLLHECAASEPPVRLTLYQGLPKFDKLELVAQKATELGACRIVPVRMERSVVKLGEAEVEKKRERLQKICQEASKQCGRARPPEVLPPLTMGQALERMTEERLLIMAWEEADGLSLTALREAQPAATEIGLVIGPEGGISGDEAGRMATAGARAVTLGPRILRTETAAIVGCALVMQLWGDL